LIAFQLLRCYLKNRQQIAPPTASMKLLCLPIAFLYAVVKGQLDKSFAFVRNADLLRWEPVSVLRGNYVAANFASLSSKSYKNLATELKSSNLLKVHHSMENSGFEPLTSTLQK